MLPRAYLKCNKYLAILGKSPYTGLDRDVQKDLHILLERIKGVKLDKGRNKRSWNKRRQCTLVALVSDDDILAVDCHQAYPHQNRHSFSSHSNTANVFVGLDK
jgi:hypothetical protein